MAKVSLLAGTTSYTADVFIADSSSTTGAGKTGLAFNSSSLTAYYVLPKAAAAVISLVTQTTTGAYSSGGFVEVDATNMPGVYRFDIPNACLAAANKSCLILLKGATGMAPLPLEIELTGWDNQDAVRGGMTALPNANAGANGGLPTGNASGFVGVQTGTGAGQLDFTAGVVKANTTQFAGQTVTAAAGVTLPSSVASPTNITAATGVTVSSVGAGAIVTASFGAAAIDSSVIANSAGDAIADRFLGRNVAGGSSAGRTVKEAIQRLRNRVGVAAGTLTVYQTDDVSALWTGAVTTTAGNPISDLDPA